VAPWLADDLRVSQSGSPAVDAGGEAGVAWDFFGMARPQGTAPDNGACEFVGE
jgi:hypothetical protein